MKIFYIKALNQYQHKLIFTTIKGLKKKLNYQKYKSISLINFVFNERYILISFGLWRLRFNNISYFYLLISNLFKNKFHICFDNPIINRDIYGSSKLSYKKPTGTEYVRIGINSPLGDGTFPKKFNNTRWYYFQKINNINLKKFKKIEKNNALLVGQKLFDASIGSIDFLRPFIILFWLISMLNQLKPYKKVYYSIHPLSEKSFIEKKIIYIYKFLEIIFFNFKIINEPVKSVVVSKDIDIAITYSSGASFDTLVNGIRTISTYKKSMIYNFFPRKIKDIENFDFEKKRNEWLNWLSYTEWSIDEVRNGIYIKYYKDLI